MCWGIFDARDERLVGKSYEKWMVGRGQTEVQLVQQEIIYRSNNESILGATDCALSVLCQIMMKPGDVRFCEFY